MNYKELIKISFLKFKTKWRLHGWLTVARRHWPWQPEYNSISILTLELNPITFLYQIQKNLERRSSIIYTTLGTNLEYLKRMVFLTKNMHEACRKQLKYA